MIDFTYGRDIPMGLGMALMQNPPAMTYFANLSAQEQQAVIDRTHSIGSKQEMRAYVNSFVAGD